MSYASLAAQSTPAPTSTSTDPTPRTARPATAATRAVAKPTAKPEAASKPRAERPDKRAPIDYPASIYIPNVPANTSSDDLIEVLSGMGEVGRWPCWLSLVVLVLPPSYPSAFPFVSPDPLTACR
jgi:hypothetical protein